MKTHFVLSGIVAAALTAYSQTSPPPAQSPGNTVPFDDVSTGTLVLQARGEGVQIYTCTKDADWAWKLKAPDATLFDEKHHAIGKHFAGPKWRLDDGSEVQGKLIISKPQTGTIPWLILSATQTGTAGQLSPADRVRRSDTKGGLAPSTGCDAQHAGAETRVEYAATYGFYNTRKTP